MAQGLSFFLVSWRNPGPKHGDWNLYTYVAAVERVIDVVREITKSEDVNLLSLCAGGILITGVLNHLAAQDLHPVHTASFGVTLLDFEVPAPIGALRLAPLLSLAGGRSARKGVLKASDLAPVFTWMRPDDLGEGLPRSRQRRRTKRPPGIS